MSIYKINFDFNNIVENLIKNINFSFSRFGDGELNCVFNKKGSNCDGHEYFTDLGVELKKILNGSPQYILGLQPLGYSIWKEKIEEFKNLEFCNSDIIHSASIKKRISELIDSLNTRKVILVGPEHLSRIPKLNIYQHVKIPLKNCWSERNRIEKEIRDNIIDNVVIIYSASMMSNVIIDSIFNDFKNKITQIDCGSVFDPYVGLQTRKYHKTIIESNENNNL